MFHVDKYLIITLFLFKVDLYNTLICNHCNGTYPESLNGIKDENQGFAAALKILTNNHTVCNNVNDLGTPLQCPKSFTMCTEIKVTLNSKCNIFPLWAISFLIPMEKYAAGKNIYFGH